MAKVFGAFLVLLAGLGVSTVEAGFRSRNRLSGMSTLIMATGPPRTSRARMIHCACFSRNTEIEQRFRRDSERSRSLIGAGAGIRRARAWAEPVVRGFIQTPSDAVAEGTARRRQITLDCWRV